MTKSELAALLAQSAELSAKRGKEVVDCVFDEMVRTLVEGGRIEIRGFGSFSTKRYQGYRGRNPKTGAEVEVRAKRDVVFRPGKAMVDRVRGLQRG